MGRDQAENMLSRRPSANGLGVEWLSAFIAENPPVLATLSHLYVTGHLELAWHQGVRDGTRRHEQSPVPVQNGTSRHGITPDDTSVTGLENRCGRQSTVGSNPTLSARNKGFLVLLYRKPLG